MKKVFIKYNPYKLQTTITVDGKGLAENSIIRDRSAAGSRLQEWVEELPEMLMEEYNDTAFSVTFQGLLADYEDLEYIMKETAEKNSNFRYQLERIPATETKDKESLIDKVFDEIQHGPFEELKSDEIISAFENARSSDFEVCVVATMSAGKSTLINALLSQKLMPSKQEACTAIITRIKDNDSDHWEAEVYNKSNELIEVHPDLSLDTMTRLNADPNVSTIRVSGDIPFLTADDVSLVLIDTPGPNNSRDPEHRRIQNGFLNKSSKSLVLYIMEGTFGSNDDNALLEMGFRSMFVDGKQSKYRFIFVINKMDDRKKEDGPTEDTLQRVRSYLRNHGIEKPNLFPVAALPALLIRMMLNKTETDEETIEDEILPKISKMNHRQSLHLENYASLPASIKDKISNDLSGADENMQAIIHTGIPSVEAAIRQYVQKYAKTAKIKNIVDTFSHKLDEVDCFERTKHELESNKEEREKILIQINFIKQKMKDAQSAKKFNSAVDSSVKSVNASSVVIIEDIIGKFQQRVTKKIDSYRGEELGLDEVKYEMESLEKFAKRLEPEFEGELDNMLQEKLIVTGNLLLNDYKKKLVSLTEEIDTNMDSIKIDPLKMIGGSVISAGEFSLKRFIKEKEVEDGEEWIENTNKKWYKPWTWFQEKGYWRTKYKTVRYVPADQLAQEFLSPIQENIWSDGENAKKYAEQQSKKIAAIFTKEFKKLDDLIMSKMKELENIASDEKNIQKRIKESESKLRWLEETKAKVDKILEI